MLPRSPKPSWVPVQSKVPHKDLWNGYPWSWIGVQKLLRFLALIYAG